MNWRTGISLFAAAVVAGALAFPIGLSAQPSTPTDLLTRVQDRLEGVQSLSANFTQTFSSAYFDETESVAGTVLLKGNMYRVVTPEQTFVTDGHVAWIFSASDNQVLINDFVEDETTFSLNAFLFGFEERYDAVEMESFDTDGRTSYVLRMNARDPAAFFPRVTMFVSAADFSVNRLQVIDANETTITLDLSRVVMNPPVQESLFRFVPPESSEIVDLRS